MLQMLEVGNRNRFCRSGNICEERNRVKETNGDIKDDKLAQIEDWLLNVKQSRLMKIKDLADQAAFV